MIRSSHGSLLLII